MIANLTRRLFEKLSRKPYREAYVAEHVATGIAHQIRALREQRGWNQRAFAQKLGKPQSVVSRLEDPDYGKYSLTSLLEIADTFDVALNVRFASFPEFLRLYSNVTPEAFEVESFEDSSFVPNADGQRVVAETVPAQHWERIVVGVATKVIKSNPRVSDIFAAVQ